MRMAKFRSERRHCWLIEYSMIQLSLTITGVLFVSANRPKTTPAIFRSTLRSYWVVTSTYNDQFVEHITTLNSAESLK